MSGDPAAEWPAERWWTQLGDPQLSTLIEEGLRNSPDLASALARIRRASALAEEAGAARLPTVDGEAEATLSKQSENIGIPPQFVPKGLRDRGRVAISAGFDLDLWGRNRAAHAAAVSEARAAEVDAAQARLVLSSTIAATYMQLAEAFDDLEVRREAVSGRESARGLIAQRLANGLENSGALRQAEAELATGRVALTQAEAEVAILRHQLAALVGAGPDRGLAIATPTISRPPSTELPATVTTELVGRRPDVVAARERVAAAAKRINVARADFYPAIRLGALLGLESLGLENLPRGGSTIASIGPAISLPIFRGGALRGRYRATRAEFDDAVAAYDRTVIQAYRETAEAATRTRTSASALRNATAAVDGAEASLRIIRDRYRAGLANYLDVLAVEDRVLDARLRLAAAEEGARAGEIALIRALGGGYLPAPPPSPAAPTNKDRADG